MNTKVAQKRCHVGRGFREGFDFWCQGKVFWRVLVGSRRSPASFLQGLAPSMVRWEVSYKGTSFQTKFEFWSGPKIRKLSQMTWGGPRASQQIFSNLGPIFFVCLGCAGGLPGQFGAFCNFFAPTKFPTFFGKISIHNPPPT